MKILCIAKNSQQFLFFKKFEEEFRGRLEVRILSYYRFKDKCIIADEVEFPRRSKDFNDRDVQNEQYAEVPDEIAKYLFADRELRHFNILGASKNNLTKDIWGYTSLLSGSLANVIDNFAPDIVVSEFITGLADSLILEQAIRRSVPFLSVRQSKLEAGIVFCLNNCDKPFRNISAAKIGVDVHFERSLWERANVHVEAIRSSYKTPSYMQKTKNNLKFDMSKLSLLYRRIRFAFQHRCPDELRDSLVWYLRKIRNALSYRRVEFTSLEYLSTKRFFVFPLHYEPEQSIDIRGFPSGQLEVVERIAKLLPPFTVLAVKEHRGNFGYRDVNDYQRIIALPNVVLLDRNLDSRELVNSSRGVLTVSGRMGWEAACLGRPLYVFGDCFYKDIATDSGLDSIESLKHFLREPELYAITSDKVISRAAHYIDATKEGSFVLNSESHLSGRNIVNFGKALFDYLQIETIEQG